ncbi:MAG: hypothetical protein ABSG32_11080 [Terriglobia bacterium]
MIHRRQFLTGVAAAVGAVAADPGVSEARDSKTTTTANAACCGQAPASLVDFRYSPLPCQHIFCFPDDPHKGVVDERGSLRYGHSPKGNQNGWARDEAVEFFLEGMGPDTGNQQRLEAPGVPIIHTRIERAEAYLELTTFATHDPSEGRVDNVIAEVRPKSRMEIHACLLIKVTAKRELAIRPSEGASTVRLGGESGALFLAADSRLSTEDEMEVGTLLRLKPGSATSPRPLRYFLRFPQEGQDMERIKTGLEKPNTLLAAARTYWQSWKPFHGEVSWRLPRPYSDFLVACTSNIQRMRNKKGERMVFQVGPTIYDGLAIVDGNFILEAARYLGYDDQAKESLAANWAWQREDGGVFAYAGDWMWKDTAIAAFSLVRQAELSQDWSNFRDMQPKLHKALQFLVELRERARKEGGANGRYGLLPRGFADGGLDGVRPEFTNTVWALAGLKAANQAAAALGLDGFAPSRQFYNELRQSFFAAAHQEMRRHPSGFDYLPMLMKEDPQWEAKDEWDRPRPQSAQWALSHAIYPGVVFDKEDPIVQGHIALMQACTQEDVPAEAGWIAHEGLWTYNGPFVSQVYLWAGLGDWADSSFHGFLNHASPLYAWVEEQSFQDSVVSRPSGDMPHNWASAECIRYLRHMLALEDGPALRLLAGIGPNQLAAEEPYAIAGSPTRFGRLNLELEPLGGRWGLKFERAVGPAPGTVQLPATLGDRGRLSRISGASFRQEGNAILVEPTARSWTAEWS